MKYKKSGKIRIFSENQENQDTFKKSGKSQESNVAARPGNSLVLFSFVWNEK
jgi:hypothetical protein